jgi:hypothetical protein
MNTERFGGLQKTKRLGSAQQRMTWRGREEKSRRSRGEYSEEGEELEVKVGLQWLVNRRTNKKEKEKQQTIALLNESCGPDGYCAAFEEPKDVLFKSATAPSSPLHWLARERVCKPATSSIPLTPADACGGALKPSWPVRQRVRVPGAQRT